MICEIRKHFRLSTDVHDSSTATITFDDGYLNQYVIASKNIIADDEGAIIFVAGRLLNSQYSSVEGG